MSRKLVTIQPVLFYAVCIALAVMQQVDSVHIGCAWVYVALRITHSIVQTIIDLVMLRFGLFVLSWLALAVMVVRGAMSVFYRGGI